METKSKFNISPKYFDEVGPLHGTGEHVYYIGKISKMFAVQIR